MIEYKQITFEEALPFVGKLLVKHRDETTVSRDLIPINPDIETYLKLEELNKLVILAVFDNGILIGYTLSILANNMHNKDLLMTDNDLLYVDDNYRDSKIGKELMLKTEELCKKAGSKLHLWHARNDSKLKQIFDKLDQYKLQDITYSKEL